MRRRHFLTLFAAVPAVVMAQRAIPAVLGAPEYIAASDNDLIVELMDASGKGIAAQTVHNFQGGGYSVEFKAEHIKGVPHRAHMHWLGILVTFSSPFNFVMIPTFNLQRGDTLTVQGGVTLS